jgi:hypothetical protein
MSQWSSTRPDVARILSKLLKYGEVRISRQDDGDEAKLAVAVDSRSLRCNVSIEAIERCRGDRVARELEDMLARFANQLG